MILDILRGSSEAKKKYAYDCADRYYIREFRRTPFHMMDLYDEFPDAPYFADGKDTYCITAEEEPEHNCDDDYEGCVLHDQQYEDWFDNILKDEDEWFIEKLQEKQRELVSNFFYETRWNRSYTICLANTVETINIFKWLAVNSDAIYAIVSSRLFGEYDTIYFKHETDYRLCSLHAGENVYTDVDCQYAYNYCGWSKIPYSEENELWLKENSNGVACKGGGYLYLSDSLDKMAWKIALGHRYGNN